MKEWLCAVLLLSTGAAGLWISGAYRRRERLLSRLLNELQRLEEQMRLGRPLAQALEKSGMPEMRGMAGEIDGIGLRAAWCAACEGAEGTQPLAAAEQPERQLLEEFFGELGVLDRRSQARRFENVRRALAALHVQAAAEALQRSRLYGTLGILLGLAAVVLLW